MKQQKIMKRVSAAVSMLVLSSSLMVGPSAHAVTPDNGQILGGVWTTANLIKTYFDWRSWAGWGTIGLTNVVITVATGDSDGAFTRAVFTNLCGSTAAGFLATWKPADGPGAAAMMKAITKAGGVVAAASACGWATQYATSRINANYPAASKAIENSRLNNVPNYNEIVEDKTQANNAKLGIESQSRRISRLIVSANGFKHLYYFDRCATSPRTGICNELYNKWKNAEAAAQAEMVTYNHVGAELAKALKELAHDVKS